MLIRTAGLIRLNAAHDVGGDHHSIQRAPLMSDTAAAIVAAGESASN
ncbi:hypothetical protein [Gordonia paraffinivorans]|nr:hypothetical protein [Gordonia paraffinivorans]